jgi:ABC-type bacteriocin/lantibiotic exporter with double-glycine peptidase domain
MLNNNLTKAIKYYLSAITKFKYLYLSITLIYAGLSTIGIISFIPLLSSALSGDAKIANFQFSSPYFPILSIEEALLLVVFMFLLKGIVFLIQMVLVARIRSELARNLRLNILTKLQAVEYSFFQRNDAGLITSVLTDHTNKIVAGFHNLNYLLINIVLAFFYFIAAFLINKFIILMSFPMFVFLIILYLLINRKIVFLAKNIATANTTLAENMFPIVLSAYYLTATNALTSKIKSQYTLIDNISKNIFSAGKLAAITGAMKEPIGVCSVILLLALTTYFDFSLVESFISIVLVYRGLSACGQAQRAFVQVLENLGSKSVFDQINKELCNNTSGKINGVKIKNLGTGLELRSVELDNITPINLPFNMKFETNTVTAIVGPSGIGKTSVFSLITGIVEPVRGTIHVAGVPFGQIDINHWRSKIGYVTQQPQIFAGTIFTNIIGEVDTSEFEKGKLEARILDLCNSCGLKDYIDSQTAGIYASVEHNGKNLSGGQKQKISIAREIFKEPFILLMDEPTSALDKDSEKQFLDNLKELSEDFTIIIVTHSQAVAEACENLIEMSAIH